MIIKDFEQEVIDIFKIVKIELQDYDYDYLAVSYYAVETSSGGSYFTKPLIKGFDKISSLGDAFDLISKYNDDLPRLIIIKYTHETDVVEFSYADNDADGLLDTFNVEPLIEDYLDGKVSDKERQLITHKYDGASKAEITEVEDKLQITFSKQLIDFYKDSNGAKVDLELNWLIKNMFISIDTLFNTSEIISNTLYAQKEYELSSNMLVIGRSFDSDLLVYDLESKYVYYFSLDTYFEGEESYFLLAKSFNKLFKVVMSEYNQVLKLPPLTKTTYNIGD